MDEKWHEDDTKTSIVIAPSKPPTNRFGPVSCIVHVSERIAGARTKALDVAELTIGRGDDCGLVIPSSHISRVHAVLRRENDAWTIFDNKSVNGILVNGVKKDSAQLNFGDRIDLGRGEILLYRPYDEDYQRALEAQKLEALGRLASGIAHDFNNVLMAIVGAATCLREDFDTLKHSGDDNDIGATIDDIMTASHRGADLARQLLGFAKQGGINNQIVDIGDLVEEVTRLVERTFEQRIRVQKAIRSKACVVADRSQLTQVMMNLCINARDAMPNGGELQISVYDGAPRDGAHDGPYTCIQLTDNGIGMSPEVRERVFEPFFSTKGEGRGTGLGMATSYGIINNCGGAIEIDSQVGVGTTVRVYLPAQSGKVRVAVAAPPDSKTRLLAPVGRGRSILLAEDQVLVRRHTSRILTRLGFSVLEACDGQEAVQVMQSALEPICLAMLDLQMPKRNGDEVCRMLQAMDSQMPIVMCSGNTDDPRITSLLEDGSVAVLSKPYNQEQLSQVLLRARD